MGQGTGTVAAKAQWAGGYAHGRPRAYMSSVRSLGASRHPNVACSTMANCNAPHMPPLDYRRLRLLSRQPGKSI